MREVRNPKVVNLVRKVSTHRVEKKSKSPLQLNLDFKPPRQPRVKAERNEIEIERMTYTITEVAELLGISKNAAYTAARENMLPVPVIKIGRRMIVSRAALDRLLAGEE